VFIVGFRERSRFGDAGVGCHEVDLTPALDAGPDRLPADGGIADIAHNRGAALIAEVMGLEIERDQARRPGSEQMFADRAADALGGAGDDGGPAREAFCAPRVGLVR